MVIPNRWLVKALRLEYKDGDRVKLIRMDDTQAPPEGTEGTVVGVDDLGTIHVAWDNGSSLGVIHGIDRIEKI